MTLTITTDAFGNGQPIPARYTCDGENISPPLSWSGVPEGTASLAIVVDDPDAPGGTFAHWLIYDLAPEIAGLPEQIPADKILRDLADACQGMNDFRQIGYGGPCPPRGTPHRYYFRLFALDRTLGVGPGVPRNDLDRVMRGHVLGEAQIMGTFRRVTPR